VAQDLVKPEAPKPAAATPGDDDAE
jgi:hypothetical protein